MTLARCPGCRARLADDAQGCGRCGCELGLVRLVERQARRYLAAALAAQAQGDLAQARRMAQAALRLENSQLSRLLLRSLGPVTQ